MYNMCTESHKAGIRRSVCGRGWRNNKVPLYACGREGSLSEWIDRISEHFNCEPWATLRAFRASEHYLSNIAPELTQKVQHLVQLLPEKEKRSGQDTAGALDREKRDYVAGEKSRAALERFFSSRRSFYTQSWVAAAAEVNGSARSATLQIDVH